jgi:KEOPS complex subunit Pcc1
LGNNNLKATATIRLDFHTEKQLNTVFIALAPEAARPTTARSQVKLKKESTYLVLEVEAADSTALRATLNAYLRWINSLDNVLALLKKP